MRFFSLILTGSLILLCGSFSVSAAEALPLQGQWLTDTSGRTLLDPQSSGLTLRHAELIHIGDNSAASAQRNVLMKIDPATGQLNAAPVKITVAEPLTRGCFGPLLTAYPDWESLTWDRQDDTTLITVTEDSSNYQLTGECASRYADTNATPYPTLLVKIKIDKALSKAEIVAVRPVQFPAEAKVGNFANDGIEGLAIDNDNQLYLALEKNQANAPMIFSTAYDDNFWQDEQFVKVKDTGFILPLPDGGNHPINGLDYLAHPDSSHPGYLLAAARNDNQLWILDLSRQKPPLVQSLEFYAPTYSANTNPPCPAYEKLDNTSIEGVAVSDKLVYLVNDPWKSQYLKNIQCPANAEHFKLFSPLLFQLDISPQWFIQ